jgi:zinc protease
MHNTKLLRYSLWLLLFTFITQVCFSQFDLNRKLIIDPDVKVGKLANGLTYYIKKNTKPEKKVQLRLVVNTGSVLEQPDQQGLAHMMEHMNFNGSKHFEKNDLISYLQSIGVKFGADLNAYTSFDETVYILPIPSDDPDKIDKGFTILEDWAENALLDTAEINKERGVVLEESRLGKGASERMGKKYFPELFNGSQYSTRLPIGKDSIIQNFKAESLIRFYKTWYRPDLMAVVVVGDIDPALAEQEIIKHFSQFKNPVQEISRPAIIPMAERKQNTGMVLTDKEQTIKILLIFNYVEKTKPIDTWAKYRETIREELFNSLINQRLNELTQQPDPPFLFGSTSFGNFIIRGYRAFISVAAVGDKPVKNAIDALVSTTESVRKFGFLQTELDRAKASLLTQTEKTFADKDKTESAILVQGYINNYLTRAPIVGITNHYAFIKQTLPTITLAEVNALAKKTESTQGKFALLLAPETNMAQLPSNTELLNLVAAAHNLTVKPYQEKAVASTLMSKKPTPGKITGEKANAVLGTTDVTFSNGITITLKPTEFKNDDIQMDAWRWGGSHNYKLADKQNAENAATIVTAMGVKDLSPIGLRKFLSGKTVNVQPYINTYDEGIEGSSSVKDFETFLQLVNLYLTQPGKDQNLFQSYINTQKGFVENMKANPGSYFSDTLTKIEFNNNPWANGLPQASDYDKINLDRSLSIYKTIFGNAYGMHFTFVGNIDFNKIKPLLETYLGSLPSSQKENKFTDEGLRPVKGIVETTIYKGAAKQSQVRIIFTGEAPYSHDENLKLKALLDALNIKFIEKLREEMGGIYGGGMGGRIINRPYNHYSITVSFPCGPENVDKLTKAALDLIKNAQTNGIEQSYLDKVKETLRKQYQDQLKQNDYWLEGLSGAWIEHDDPMWILDYSKKVDALSVQDLQQTAKKYFNMQNYIKAVLNPEK